MADAMKEIHVTIITPARSILDENAVSVVAPAFDGELGVLHGHAALMALLGNGSLRVTRPDGSRKHLAIRGGFLQVSKSGVTVLTPEAAAPEDLDANAVQAEIAKVKGEVAKTLEERETRDQRMQWALAKRKILEASRNESRN